MDISDSDKKQKKREKVANYQVLDCTTSSAAVQLAVEEERQERRQGKPRRTEAKKDYAVGRYDENRVNLYASDLFDDPLNAIDGFAGARTVHIGLDLGGPIGTKVYAFTDGVLHSAGYNAALGDYGNVIVIEHDLGPQPGGDLDGETRKVWALYGHLDDKSIVGRSKGKKIKKGQVIGRLGDIHENGGW
jgi:murein DD-endopeptidase MepM/ murein hydrolase activator NlpD